MQTIYTNKELALQRAKESMGKSFGDINQIIIDRGGKDGLSNTKGGLGNILQEGWFNIPANSFAEADLEEAGLEIKVTGYKPDVRNGGFKAKERLVCNIINYETENLDDFYQSSFWQKNKSILLFAYQYQIGVHRSEYTIVDAQLIDLSSPEFADDLQVIQDDWRIITDKIPQGRAHQLSESDTRFLGACTKGANSSSLRKQLYSTEWAMQRAYSLKIQYLSVILKQRFELSDASLAI